MAITAAMVKELRERSGAGMMDAKKALVENDGDVEQAMDWLRTKGLAKAAKKAGRVAAEGLVGVAVEGGRGVAVEVNSETDFVAKNAEFQTLVTNVTKAGLGVSSVEELSETQVDGKPVKDLITDKIATIGENLTLRRMVAVEGDNVASYIHTAAADGLGRIAVLVAYKGDNNEVARQVAMHVAASNPQSFDEKDLDPAILERERQVLTEQAKESGKPDNVIEKMIEGRMQKFLKEITLVNQAFVIDPDKTVAKAAKDAGIELTAYARVEVGEGVEKEEEDFAEEVKKTLGQ